MTSRAPKQWTLTKSETVTSFENWKQNLQYILSLDQNFSAFLEPNAKWTKKTSTNPNRGFSDDPESVHESKRRTAEQKAVHLDMMLGQIANYCPVISRNTIVRNSVDTASIWQAIRSHFGFQSTGSHFLDLAELKLENEERPEDLFQRITAFFEDNLLSKECGLTHHGEKVDEEDTSPSLENTIVLLWLQLVHRDLPKLVKQRYGTELRSRTLASIKTEISQALDSLLDELNSGEGRVNRMSSQHSFNNRNNHHRQAHSRHSHQPSNNRSQNTSNNYRRPKPSCPICKQANKKSDHFLSSCSLLPDDDRKFMSRARLIQSIEDEQDYCSDEYNDDHHYDSIPLKNDDTQQQLNINRVQIKPSPSLQVFYNHHPITLTLDTGAETNLIKERTAIDLGLQISPSTQFATQADGLSQLNITGETKIIVQRDGKDFSLDALVAQNIDADVLAGIPFMANNDLAIRPATREIQLSDGTIYHYGPQNANKNIHSVRRAQSTPLRAPPVATTIWPGEYVEVYYNPKEVTPTEDCSLALEPRVDTNYNIKSNSCWPFPAVIQSIAGKIRIPNDTDYPIVFKRNEHLAQVSPLYIPEESNDSCCAIISLPTTIEKSDKLTNHSKVTVDPDNILPGTVVSSFKEINKEFDEVFDTKFKGYNGALGPLSAVINMGPVQPPQRKGRLPQYSRNKLEELQLQFDNLEALGVFAKPENIGVTAEYINPSFLVKKSDGGNRLVTAFTEVGKYSKPQPSLMPDVDSTLREIAKWKFIIKTDLTKAFYQIPLSKESIKYCGVATPFRGIRVYQRCAMGMPGSETALEELMTRILGDLLFDGKVAKIADDLYCGSDNLKDLQNTWRSILTSLRNCNLNLSPSKTIICPVTTVILGWKWTNGQLSATKHRISTLSSCDPPTTVKGLRSFIGAYKVLSRVIKGCSNILSPLEAYVASKSSSEKVMWSENLQATFKNAKDLVSSSSSITLPKPTDQLWIVTDGAVKDPGVGATLYVTRDGSKPLLAGFFSAKLKKHQPSWLPCEIEALSIATAIKHFSPYIIQSTHQTCVLTDSKPCVQAFGKLSRGCFSASSRVTTFLTTASCYHVSIRHLSGSANLPSDFSSRNAPECENPKCQICQYVESTEGSVISSISVSDIVSGKSKLPFTSRPTWLSTQSECADLRRTIAHLKQGTRPSKKITNIKDVKRYLRHCSLARDGLLIVRKVEPFSAARECITVPRVVLPGLLTALHIRLQHPTPHQLKQVFTRYFFALDLDKAIDVTSESCHQCASLKKVPSAVVEQSTKDPPNCIGIDFACDVIRRSRQFILLVRETVTSFTAACIISDEKCKSLRDGLLQLILPLHPVDSPIATIRTDPAPGFLALSKDTSLASYNVTLDIGEAKNINKNPIAEKAVQELEREILQHDPSGDPISQVILASSVSRLNTRIRNRGLSAHEMWFRREQHTNSCLSTPTDDHLIIAQHENRLASHTVDRNKTGRKPPPTPSLSTGDIVYLRTEGSKVQARSRYLVVSIETPFCYIRKFTDTQYRKKTYKVKLSDCFLASCSNTLSDLSTVKKKLDEYSSDSDNEVHIDTSASSVPNSPCLPPIPNEISSIPEDIERTQTSQPDTVTDSTNKPKRIRRQPPWLSEYVTYK